MIERNLFRCSGRGHRVSCHSVFRRASHDKKLELVLEDETSPGRHYSGRRLYYCGSRRADSPLGVGMALHEVHAQHTRCTGRLVACSAIDDRASGDILGRRALAEIRSDLTWTIQGRLSKSRGTGAHSARATENPTGRQLTDGPRLRGSRHHADYHSFRRRPDSFVKFEPKPERHASNRSGCCARSP